MTLNAFEGANYESGNEHFVDIGDGFHLHKREWWNIIYFIFIYIFEYKQMHYLLSISILLLSLIKC